jgi:hypothetical protein
MPTTLTTIPRGRKVGPAIFDRRRERLCEGLSLYYSSAITGPTGLDLLDLSGFNINGTLTGMDAPSDWVLSSPGNVLTFDGVNDQITASSPVPLTTYPFTISGWAYLPTTIPNTTGALIVSVGLGLSQYFGIGVQAATPRPRIFARNTTFLSAGPSTGTYGNEWALITGVFASATRRDLYYNGLFIGSSSTNVPEIQSNSLVRVGNAFNQLYWNSLTSEVIIHRRELQVGEIAELFDLGIGGLGRTSKRSFLVKTVSSTGNRRRRIICGGNC